MHFLETGVRRHRIEQDQKRDGLALGLELLRHFERNLATKTVAAQIIRTFRLKSAQLGNVMSRHLFDAWELFEPIHSARMETIKGLVVAQMTSKVGITPEHSASRAVDQEERRFGALRLNRHERRARLHRFCAA